MSQMVETFMYQTGQIFLIPTLATIGLLFLYAFFTLGAFAVQWWQRRHSVMSFDAPRGFPLLAWARSRTDLGDDECDIMAHKLIELPSVATRVAPMLGLVATMIPMGPALKGLADGNLAQVSNNLTVAFSAVILALISAAITYWVLTVRRRWLAEELAWLAARAGGHAAEAP